MTQQHWTQDPEQVRLLEQRLCGTGMSRRRFLQVVAAAGAAAAAGATATATAQASQAAPAGATSAPPTRLARDQILKLGSYTTDPSSHDFNADLYCGGEPSLFAGLTVFDH